MNEYGDFEEIKEEAPVSKEKKDSKTSAVQQEEQQQFTSRARLPRPGQFIGVVIQRLGGNRMSVKTTDNKVRNCRVPGRYSRKFWLRPKDFVMIEPWPDDNDKGDIVYQYRGGEISFIKRKGFTTNLESEF